jgi:uncharacterized lipoprotein YddW (UPF0748 family)
MAKFGLDPRTIDESDPRWLTHRATFITEFLRELRQSLALVTERSGRKQLSITAIVLGSESENLFNALDLRQWVAQGLVDTIIAYSSFERDTCSTWDTFTSASDSAYLRDITTGSATKLAVGLLPRQQPATTYLQRARVNYEAGVDHLFFWDADQRAEMGRSWQAIRRLGHRDDILARSGEIDSLPAEQGTFVRQVGQWDLRVQCPG